MNIEYLEKTMSLKGKGAVILGRCESGTIAEAVKTSLAMRDAEVKCIDVALDTDFVKEYERAERELGSIDILVNCTDRYYSGNLIGTLPKQWEESYRNNVEFVFEAVNAVIPFMKEHGGAVVQVSCGTYAAALPAEAPYLATTFANVRMMKNFADEVSQYKIRFNTILAGYINTGKSSEPSDNWIGRSGTLEDIAEAVAYVVSPAAKFINADTIMLDGGSRDSGLH